MSRILRAGALLLFVYILCFTPASAQQPVPADTADIWSLGGLGTINVSQVSLNNWAAGGESSLSVLGVANLYANYKHGRHNWDNALDVTYGTVKLQDQQLRKSDDKLELNAKYGYKASKRWFYSAQLNVKTQLTPTYTETRDSMISGFMSPAFILASLGMDYKPSSKLSVFISPLTSKLTVVTSQLLADKGAFGVDGADKNAAGNLIAGTGSHLREEFGGYVNVRYKEEILQNITLVSKLDLFSNYLKSPQNIDLNWENSVNFKVNKFISANLFVHMIYDDDVNITVPGKGDGKPSTSGPRLQVKQALGIGFSYKFD